MGGIWDRCFLAGTSRPYLRLKRLRSSSVFTTAAPDLALRSTQAPSGLRVLHHPMGRRPGLGSRAQRGNKDIPGWTTEPKVPVSESRSPRRGRAPPRARRQRAVPAGAGQPRLPLQRHRAGSAQSPTPLCSPRGATRAGRGQHVSRGGGVCGALGAVPRPPPRPHVGAAGSGRRTARKAPPGSQ